MGIANKIKSSLGVLGVVGASLLGTRCSQIEYLQGLSDRIIEKGYNGSFLGEKPKVVIDDSSLISYHGDSNTLTMCGTWRHPNLRIPEFEIEGDMAHFLAHAAYFNKYGYHLEDENPIFQAELRRLEKELGCSVLRNCTDETSLVGRWKMKWMDMADQLSKPRNAQNSMIINGAPPQSLTNRAVGQYGR